MLKKLLSLASVACLLFSLISCGGGSAPRHVPAADTADRLKTDRMNEALMLSAASYQKPLQESYLIGPEDLLEIEAYNVEELKKTVRVNSQGEIALPLVGILHVKGLTTSEAEQLIAKKLDRYVQETVVTVYIREYKSQQISVVGAVKSPQIFAVTGQRYLLDLLMMAGGLAPEAGSICYVIRPADKNSPGQAKAGTIVIDLNELLLNANFSLNIPVFAGDVINVPRGGIIFVDGAVNIPGAYTLRGRTTLIQAIAMAHGIGGTAKSDDVRIFRDNGRGEKDIITADYKKMINGEIADIEVRENDIIIVPESGIKNFFRGFIGTFKGAVSIGSGSVGF